MNKKEIKHFKAMLRQGSLRHMNIILDDKFQSELLDIIKDYEKQQLENKKYKEVIDRIKKYIEPLITNRDDPQCYPISWYSKDVLLQILKEVK